MHKNYPHLQEIKSGIKHYYYYLSLRGVSSLADEGGGVRCLDIRRGRGVSFETASKSTTIMPGTPCMYLHDHIIRNKNVNRTDEPVLGPKGLLALAEEGESAASYCCIGTRRRGRDSWFMVHS